MYRASKRRNLRDIPLLVNFLTKPFEKICKSKYLHPIFRMNKWVFSLKKRHPSWLKKCLSASLVSGVFCLFFWGVHLKHPASKYIHIESFMICLVLRSWSLEINSEQKNMFYQIGKFQSLKTDLKKKTTPKISAKSKKMVAIKWNKENYTIIPSPWNLTSGLQKTRSAAAFPITTFPEAAVWQQESHRCLRRFAVAQLG